MFIVYDSKQPECLRWGVTSSVCYLKEQKYGITCSAKHCFNWILPYFTFCLTVNKSYPMYHLTVTSAFNKHPSKQQLQIIQLCPLLVKINHWPHSQTNRITLQDCKMGNCNSLALQPSSYLLLACIAKVREWVLLTGLSDLLPSSLALASEVTTDSHSPCPERTVCQWSHWVHFKLNYRALLWRLHFTCRPCSGLSWLNETCIMHKASSR